METQRRRSIQEEYNLKHGIVPKTIRKDVRDVLEISKKDSAPKDIRKMPKKERLELIAKLTKEMRNAAKILEFEHAAYLRDRIEKIKATL